MSTAPPTRALRDGDRPAFIDLMAAAFVRDPLFLDLFGDDRQEPAAARRRAAFFAFLFDRSRMAGHTLRGAFDGQGRLQACCLVEDSAHKDPMLRVLLRFALLLPRLPWRSSRLLNRYMRRTRRVAPRRRHHYLTMIGVLPEHQGQGIGTRLLQELIHTARQTPGVRAVALDTENPANVPRYQKLGFLATKQLRIGRTTVHSMVLWL